MSISLTVKFTDEDMEPLKVKVRDDVTIGDIRAAAAEGGMGLEELILDSIEEVEGYDSVDDLPWTTLGDVVLAVGELIRGASQRPGGGATRSQRRQAGREERKARKRSDQCG